MPDVFFNVMAWVFILFGMVVMATMIGLCFWLINEEMNK
jgi:hypothetical protein